MPSAVIQKIGPSLGLARASLTRPPRPDREAKQTNNEKILTILFPNKKKKYSARYVIHGNYDFRIEHNINQSCKQRNKRSNPMLNIKSKLRYSELTIQIKYPHLHHGALYKAKVSFNPSGHHDLTWTKVPTTLSSGLTAYILHWLCLHAHWSVAQTRNRQQAPDRLWQNPKPIIEYLW